LLGQGIETVLLQRKGKQRLRKSNSNCCEKEGNPLCFQNFILKRAVVINYYCQDDINDSRSIYPMVFRNNVNLSRAKFSNRELEEGNYRKTLPSRTDRLFAKV